MDPFTQRILERAEQRSRTLGISKSTKYPLSDRDNAANRLSGSDQDEQKKSLEREVIIDDRRTAKDSSKKVTHSFSTTDKENCDVGIEISITTGSNVEVQVEVDEREIDAHGNEVKRNVGPLEPSAQLRESSRNRLQRLGILYSDTDSLSSPIHRTEDKFHEEISDQQNNEECQRKRPKHKFGKLVALADSIKNWEDDTSHPDYKHANLGEKKSTESPVKMRQKKESIGKGDNQRKSNTKSTGSPRKSQQSAKHSFTQKTESENITAKQTKQISWDEPLLRSLEPEGLHKQTSASTPTLRFEIVEQIEPPHFTRNKTAVAEPKITKTTVPSAAPTATTSAETRNVEGNYVSSIRTGLVSGRTAEFEKAAGSPTKQQQKDPAEMTLKERMMLFEKNKGAALIPKAAFAMAVPIGSDKTKVVPKSVQKTTNQFAKERTDLPKDFPTRDVNIRDKLAALHAGSRTISENNIKAELEKKKQNDMDVLLNRFNKQKELTQNNSSPHANLQSKETIVPAPPPPPPQQITPNKPQHVEAKCMITSKRRSPGQKIDGTELPQSFDDTKRVKINPSNKANRLYPVLSDIETSESENDNCATATVSAYSSDDKRNDGEQEDDFELDESLMESEEDDDAVGICDVSLRREIMQAVRNNESQSAHYRDKDKKHGDSNGDVYYGDSSLNSGETSDYSGCVDDYLNEALDDEEGEEESDSNNGQSGSERSHTNGTTSSNSFCYRSKPHHFDRCQAISENDEYTENFRCPKTPVKSSLKIDPSDDNGTVTLVHTVSFYRRQQSSNSQNSTPVKKIQRNQISGDYTSSSNDNLDNYATSESDSEQDVYQVQEKIKKLLDEVCKQQQVIAQTSQALNLCASTIEFSGSTEAVEGERHLLVATHRRQAALDEVQRLRIEGSLRPSGSPKEKGRLTVKEITVPLNQDYIRKLSGDKIAGHHFVCLLKYNENVLATKTVPSLPGLIAVKFPDVLQLNNVYADFKMTLEIYGMTAQREVLPHEVKYHINLNKKGGSKTPKKKGADSRLVMPMIQSPAGPNVVRTPALVQYGFVIFSLREIQRTAWTLTQVSNVSPLEGFVHMKVNCELSVSLEHKGFLTMFEDISGFGAWHRRWCQLNGHVLNYWKYPDDEKKKTPIGTIDLYACCSKKVSTAPRDVCARLNTFLLECQRPAKETDVESLLTIPQGKVTIVRHLLSADTKEEREEWCAYLNKALTLLRAWGNSQ